MLVASCTRAPRSPCRQAALIWADFTALASVSAGVSLGALVVGRLVALTERDGVGEAIATEPALRSLHCAGFRLA